MGEEKQKKTEYGRLRLHCALAVQAILGFHTQEEPGEHARGVFRVRLEPGKTEGELVDAICNGEVTLQRLSESGKPEPLFSGYAESVRISSEGGYREAELTVLSGTVLYDRKKRNRVFQKPGQKYLDLAERIAGEAERGACILPGKDRETGQPFFQYGETDWEFLKRMLGYGGLKPVPDAYSSRPRFYLGLRRGRLRELPGGSDVWMSFEGERYYRLSGKGAPVERRDFFCYHVSTWKELDLGERVRLEGREFGVHKKEMRLEEGEVWYTYLLAGESYSRGVPEGNPDMTGLTLMGEITETAGEQCEMVLDLEPGQAGGTRYPFASRSGNFMYCMPQKGTRAGLSLGNGEERSGMVSDCIRTNGGSCEGTASPEKKSFRTEYGKGMELFPGSMELGSGEKGILSLKDSLGAELKTEGSILMCARGEIRMEGEGEVSLEGKPGILASVTEGGSSMSLNGRFDFLASGSIMAGTEYGEYEDFDDAPKEVEFDWEAFIRNALLGLGVTVVFAFAAFATGGAAAFLLAGAAAGAGASTVFQSLEDLLTGNVRSEEEFATELLIDSLVGAVTGGIEARLMKLAIFDKIGSEFLKKGLKVTMSALVDVAAGIGTRGMYALTDPNMSLEDRLKYMFDPWQLATDFGAGLVIGGIGEWRNRKPKGGKYSVDSTMFPDDKAAGVLKNGEYVKNPTARNIRDYIKEGSNYLGNKNMNGQYMYVVDLEGNIIIGTRGGQRMPHPTLVGGHNPQVQAAGMVEIRGGKIYSVNNASGHFKPENDSLKIAEEAFGRLPHNIFSKNFQGYISYGE